MKTIFNNFLAASILIFLVVNFSLAQNAEKKKEIRSDSEPGSNQITSVLVDSEKELWVGSDGGGIWRYKGNEKNPTVYLHNSSDKESIQNNKPLCFAEDKSGNIWIGRDIASSGRTNFERRNLSRPR